MESLNYFDFFKQKTILGTTTTTKQIEFLKKALDEFSSDDDMIILNGLYELSSNLSLANDSIVEDPNCLNIIKELIKQLDKVFYLPEIAITSVLCINYLLDINPRYHSVVIKNGGIPKILVLTQNIEYIDLAENAIKCIDKLSLECPYSIIEADGFNSILSLIDFFDMNMRKLAVRSCLNMSRCITNNDLLTKNIFPSIPTLTMLLKNNEDTKMQENVLTIFLNIFSSIKVFNIHSQNKKVILDILNYGLTEYLITILTSYSYTLENKEEKISGDSVKVVLKIMEIISTSNEALDLLLNFNVLKTCYQIMSYSNTNKSTHNLYTEIFAFLGALFPSTEKKEKIMASYNNTFYYYFSEKILIYIIENIINIPAVNSVISIIKLIALFVKNSEKDNIIAFVDPNKLANICCKMLDSKDSQYIIEVMNLIDFVMDKVPNKYIISFIREGVLPNIINLKKAGSDEILIFDSTEFVKDYSALFKKTSMNLPSSFFEEPANNEEEEEEEDEIQALTKKSLNEMKITAPNDSNIDSKLISEVIKNEKNDEDMEALESEPSINEPLSFHIKNTQNPKKTTQIKKTMSNQIPSIGSVLKNFKDLKDIKDFKDLKEVKEIILGKSAKTKNEAIILSINHFAEMICDKYFNEDNIQTSLLELNLKNHPKSIIENLKVIGMELSKNPIENLQKLKSYISEGITFYEIENSKIIENLAMYFDNNFGENFNRIKDDNNEHIDVCGNYDKSIITKIKLFIEVFNFRETNKNILEFVNLLQNSITSMNCFKLLIYDYKNNKLSFGAKQKQKFKIKFLYANYSNNNNIDSNEILKKNFTFEENACFQNLVKFFTLRNSFYLVVDSNDTFSEVSSKLIKSVDYNEKDGEEKLEKTEDKEVDLKDPSKDIRSMSEASNPIESMMNEIISKRKTSEDDRLITEQFIKHLSNKKERKQSTCSELDEKIEEAIFNKVEIKFYVETDKTIFEISNDWDVNTFTREIRNRLSKQDFQSFAGKDITIKFEFTKKFMTEDQIFCLSKNLDNSIPILCKLEQVFVNKYNTTILNNSSLYLIKRLCPFMFMLSIMNLSLIQFNFLFVDSQDDNEVKEASIEELSKSFENKKITSLILKQAKDPYSISINSIPNWCKSIVESFNFSCGFNSRYLLFKVTSFDVQRSLSNLHIYLKNFFGENVEEEKGLVSKSRVKVNRNSIIKSVQSLYNSRHASSSNYLDFEFEGEVGTGLGPTQEFYSLFFNEIQNEVKFYKTSDRSLFPMPLNSNIEAQEEKIKKLCEYYRIIGFMVARALYDDRLIDFPLSSIFWNLVLDRSSSKIELLKLDPHIFRFYFALLNEMQISKESKIKLNNKELDSLMVNFTLPGTDIELCNQGEDKFLSADNVNEYLSLLHERILGLGIEYFAQSFKQGFDKVFKTSNLQVFTSLELETSICGSYNEIWTKELLESCIITNHGYFKHSNSFKYLIEFMVKLTSIEKKAFLTFITGCPRLPLGGIKNLSPKLTIVKRQVEDISLTVDDYLPTVMT